MRDIFPLSTVCIPHLVNNFYYKLTRHLIALPETTVIVNINYSNIFLTLADQLLKRMQKKRPC